MNQGASHHTHDGAHGHGQGHDHAHQSVSGCTMAAALALTVTFVVGEAIAGWVGHSLALLSDAGHNVADAAALAFSWYALSIADKPSHHRMTYGYHRVGILAALVNAVSLVVIALLIVGEAIGRIRHPHVASGGLMVGMGTAAIAVNGLIGMWLHSGSKDDVNVRSAYLHMVGDALSACGVVVAGAIIVMTHSSLADPVVSCLIAGLILWSSWGVLRETVTVLLEGTPAGTDMAAVAHAITHVPGVLDGHDLHVWTVGPGVVARSCHILVAEQSVREGPQVLRAVVRDVGQRFRITHTTVQVEVEGCPVDDMYCTQQRSTRRCTGV